MIGSFIKLFSVGSQSKHPIMHGDSLLQLIDTNLSFETSTFLRDLVHLALLSDVPRAIIHRFMVKSLTQVRNPQPPHHQTIVVELINTQQTELEPILMFLERSASTN